MADTRETEVSYCQRTHSWVERRAGECRLRMHAYGGDTQ